MAKHNHVIMWCTAFAVVRARGWDEAEAAGVRTPEAGEWEWCCQCRRSCFLYLIDEVGEGPERGGGALPSKDGAG